MNKIIKLILAIALVSNQSLFAQSNIDWTNVVTVGSSRFGNTIRLGGTVVPAKQVSLNAQFPGRINYLAGKVGDNLEQGVVLVQIDDTALLAKRQEVLANIDVAYSNLQNADVQHSRAQISPDYNPMLGSWSTMFGKMPNILGNGNKEVERYANVYSYQNRYEQAQAGLLAAEAQLKQLDTQLRDAQTIAPFQGTIVRKAIEVGDTVQPGMPLLVFADLSHLQVVIEAPTRLIPNIKPGMLLSAKIDSSNIQMEVEVAQIFPVANLQKHTVKVKLNLPKQIPTAPGAYAEISIPDGNSYQESYPIVPRSALLWRGTLPAVFLVNAKGETELRLVRLGEMVGNNMVTILSGIKVGDKIFATPKAHGWKNNKIKSNQF